MTATKTAEYAGVFSGDSGEVGRGTITESRSKNARARANISTPRGCLRRGAVVAIVPIRRSKTVLREPTPGKWRAADGTGAASASCQALTPAGRAKAEGTEGGSAARGSRAGSACPEGAKTTDGRHAERGSRPAGTGNRCSEGGSDKQHRVALGMVLASDAEGVEGVGAVGAVLQAVFLRLGELLAAFVLLAVVHPGGLD